MTTGSGTSSVLTLPLVSSPWEQVHLFIDFRSNSYKAPNITYHGKAFTITGTIYEVNQVLKTLVFTPKPNDFGICGIDIFVTDFGNIGIGGILNTTAHFYVNILPVNDPPV